MYGYNITIGDNKKIGILFEALKSELMQNDCMDDRVFFTLDEYKSVHLPFSQVQRLKFNLVQRATVDELFGIFLLFSMYRAYCKKFPGNRLLEKLRDEYCHTISDVEQFTYPGYIILGVNN